MCSSNQWLIDLSKDESLWAKDLELLPSMIHFEYSQLKNLAVEGQVYGVLLQCKDTYETILKIPVIMALVIIDSDSKYKDGSEYNDIMKTFLQAPMSMGNWENLARVIIKKNKKLNLPETLINILEKTRTLYNTEITAKVSDVVAWRNETIGHGALKFEDDVNYQEEVRSLLNLLKNYFDGEGKQSIKGLYNSIYFQCGNNKLVADCYGKSDSYDLVLHIADNSYTVSNYVNEIDLKWYLFESFYCRKNLVKYCSYIDGKNSTVQNKYFSDLYEKHVLRGNRNSSIAGNFISRTEDRILEYLNMPMDYVKPVKLLELLQEQMDNLEKGVITLFMERGTGKSAFANQMSGLYHSEPLLKNSLSRCYHLSNAALRGNSDFVNSINNGFRHSYNPANDLWGSTEELPSLTLETENPAEDMAEFLNFYHDKYQKDYTILVIDGIDETTEQTDCILNYIPSKEQLDDGVFVVLTTRFNDEATVQGKSKKYIEQAIRISDAQISIRRHDPIIIELLNNYIEKHYSTNKINQNFDKNELIQKSDYRILYLRAYLGINDRVPLDNTDETKFIKSYMEYLLPFYGINQKQALKEVAVTIALFPDISISKYQEYLNCQEITYEFVGLFNDLSPLLTVLHKDGEAVYEFADTAYADFIIEEYPDIVKDVVHFFYQSMYKNLEKYFRYGGYFLRELSKEFLKSLNVEEISDEQKLNNDIIFFSTSLIELWSKTKKHKIILDLFFDKIYILCLYLGMNGDPWSNYGYAKLIRMELRDCIEQAISSGLQKECGKACKGWIKNINRFINNAIKENSFIGLDIFYCDKTVEKLYKSLLKNYLNTSDIEDWFWVFGSVISHNNEALIDVFKLIKELNKEDSFVEYILNSQSDLKMSSHSIIRGIEIEKLLKVNLSPKNEEKLLNHLLKFYTQSFGFMAGKNFNDLAKDCLDTIKAKGYRVYNEKLEGLLEHGTSYQEKLHRKIEKAIEMLLDFERPLEHQPDKTNEVFDAYHTYSMYDLCKYEKETIDVREDDLKALNQAFFSRMCYERDNGNLGDFLENQIQTDDHIESILKCRFGVGVEWYEELLKWIESIKIVANKDRKHVYKLLTRMMYLAIRYLEDNRRADEALLLLEEMVYETDTKGFFSSYFAGLITNAVEPNLIYDLPDMVYCTDNCLYLLVRLFENDDIGRADTLLKTMEKSIRVIDEDQVTNYETQAMCEIQKIRFLSVRNMFGIHNEFDLYLEECIENHKKRIDAFVSSISRNSSFREFSYDLEMLLEFDWQARKYKEGKELCDYYLNLLSSLSSDGDMVVKDILDSEVKKLQGCKEFFAWLEGKEALQQNNDDYRLKASSYNVLCRRTLYKSVSRFKMRKKNTDADRRKFEDLTKIKLEYY